MSVLVANMQLRPAAPGDASRLARLAEHVGGSWDEARFAGSLAGTALGWVVDAANPVPSAAREAPAPLRPAIAAAIIVQSAPDDWEVLDLVVAPPCQRQGLARVLLDHVHATALAAGAGRLILEVRASNLRAQAVYAAGGFREVARRPRYYAATTATPVEDAIVMACPL
jgi:ribosomal protein S18 acetylase RimI-like enzyme